MDYVEGIIEDLDKVAVEEIMKYGVPSLDDYNDTISVATELGKRLDGNLSIIKLSARFLDIKLGEATSQKKISEHVTMALGFAKEFLGGYPLEEDIKEKVFKCITEHHLKEFSCVESEICANAICYNYLVPKKILKMFYSWNQKGYSYEEGFLFAEEKLNEKWNSLTLSICKEELAYNYKKIKEFLELGRKDPISFVVKD